MERVPWAEGKSNLTTEYSWFLAGWARRMSWKEVAGAFHASWDRVYEAVKQAVSWGLARRNLEGIKAIGVDEVQWQRGHRYQTVVYQLNWMKARSAYSGLVRTGLPRPCCGSSTSWERNAALHCSSCAVT